MDAFRLLHSIIQYPITISISKVAMIVAAIMMMGVCFAQETDNECYLIGK